ncbi:MAG TPA: class I SAM-dependent methyltransferase [bacterium]|nr:class I SAM-dependent methyltransferase [bacterium]
MDEAALFHLLDELAEFGRAHDARESERSRRLLNITPEAGRFLSILVRVLGARTILELGTSNGYSTIWLAWAASATGGHVTTVDQAPHKVAMARENLARAGVGGRVTIREARILDVLPSIAGPVDFILLDADRPSYLTYLGPLLRLLRPGGLLATDNVVSHASEVTAFMARLRADPALETVTLPVGSGVELTYKRTP